MKYIIKWFPFIILTFFFFSGHPFIALLMFGLSMYIRSLFLFDFPENATFLWLGVPGSGKTTIAAWICNHYLNDKKNDKRIFSNVPITGTFKYSWKEDFGHYNMSNSVIICDEAGIYLNGRNWKKNFDDDSLEQAKKFRHDDMTLHFFSQSDDEYPVIRNLSNKTYVVEKSLLKWFVTFRCVGKKRDILENTRKCEVCEFWVPFSKKYVFCPPAWKLFDSWESKDLPDKEFEQW